MNILKGLEVLVSVGEVAVGAQRGASLNRSADVIDVSNKVSGGWRKSLTGLKEWSVDCDGLFAYDDEGYKALEVAFNEGEEVDLKIGTADGSVNYSGKAVITDFPIDAPYDDSATYSVSFTGTGELETGEGA